MRKSLAFFGGALFVVMSLSIYLVVDQLSRMPSYESVIEAQVNRKVIEPLVKIEKDMDRLEEKIKVSQKAVNQLTGGVLQLDDKMLKNQVETEHIVAVGPSSSKTFQSLVHAGERNNDGCTFSSRPSGLLSDIKMLDVYDFLPFDNPDGGPWKQGWRVQREKIEEHLDVFVVPHSHNDPGGYQTIKFKEKTIKQLYYNLGEWNQLGWIKTLDTYYQDQTRHILDNVVDALALDKRRKFIWAEMSYLSMWWGDVDERRKKLFKEQVKNGQLEIVTGGWVMNDEANTHYFAMIDQLIEGQQWLEANIGAKPRAGWAIDPFGHTPTMAYILKRSGFHSMLIQRTHYAVKRYLARRKKLEFMWRQNWDHSSTTDMFCHMMPFYSYDVPHTCGPEPAICCQFDFRRLPGGGIHCPWNIPPVKIDGNNVAERAEKLVDQYRKKATLYKGNVVLIPLGDDFRYEMKFETTEQFSNYQKLFDYINSHPELKVKAQFGTLSDYFNKIWEKTGVKPGNQPPGYPTLSGDFYTYADRDDHYWSGYYTSRPFYKNMDRVLESRLRAAEIIYHLAFSHARKEGVTSFPSSNLFHLLMQARRNLGVFQHHDGITGTAKDHVVVDYGVRLLRSLQDTARIIEDSSYFLLHKSRKDFQPTGDSMITMIQYDEERKGQDGFPTKRILPVKNSKPRKVTLYNSLEDYRIQVTSVYVSTPKVKVTNASGHLVKYQVSPVFDNDFNPVPDSYRVHFVSNIPPLGLATYTIEEQSSAESHSSVSLYHFVGDVMMDKSFKVERQDWSTGDIVLENEQLHITFDSSHGMMTKLTTIKDGRTLDVLLAFMTYGTTGARDRSGAYLFLPDGPAQPLSVESHSKMILLKGSVFSELTVDRQLVKHTVRIYNVPGAEGMAVDIENTVDIRSEQNKELAMRFTTNIQNNNEFFTDLNGFQMQLHRTLRKLPLQANFYPMPNSVIIQDKKRRLTLHSAQANGVACLKSGSVEVILDRRLAQDDNRGLGQGVLDNKRTPSNFRLFVEKLQTQKDESLLAGVPVTYNSLASHTVSQHLLHPISVLHHSHATKLRSQFAGLTRPLPCDTFIVNLRTIQKRLEPEPTERAALLIRRHGYDCSFQTWCNTSQGKIRLSGLFKDLEISSIQKTSLTLMHDGKTLARDSTLELAPMEIYSFKLELD